MRIEVQFKSNGGKEFTGFVYINDMVSWLTTPVISLTKVKEFGLQNEVYATRNRYWCDLNIKAVRQGREWKKVTFRVARVGLTNSCIAII